MILDEVVLENVGVFGGRQSITLTPKGKKRRITLVGGLNGRGKTTLLDAIQIALYGNRARPSNRGTLGYDEFLQRTKSRHASTAEPFAIELSFTITEGSGDTQYRIRRNWESTTRGFKETIEVSRDNLLDRALTATWAEHIEELLPLEISSLFFFDGEKIESLADPERASGVISAAVSGLLGLGVIERLQRDLLVIERRKQDVGITAEVSEELQKLEKEVHVAEAEFAEVYQRRAGEQNTLDRLEVELVEADKVAKREGGDLFERRVELEKQHQVVSSQVSQANAQLREFAMGALPLAICGSLLSSLADQQGSVNSIEPDNLENLFRERDAALLKKLQKKISDNEISIVENELIQDREQRVNDARSSTAYRPALTSVRASIAAQQQIEEDRLSLNSILDDRSTGLDLVADFERQLAGVPGEEAIAHFIRTRDGLREKAGEARGRISVLDEELQRLDRAKIATEDNYERVRQTAALSNLQGQDAGRILEHSAKVRSTLDLLKGEVRKRSIDKIEKEVLKCYRQLIGKKGLIIGLSLDVETCTPLITTRDAGVVPIERLSAAERQLFAVSMLWGLALVAGRTLPTIIDTPLGRLDSIHRSLVVDRYFPNASAQVILLSTDEEIDEKLAARLEPAIGRMYKLEYNEERQVTEILDGYFESEVPDVA